MIDKLIYTYWTNSGENFTSGFYDEDSFLSVFFSSLNKAKKFFNEVVIYTDVEGKQFLESKNVVADFIVVDYNSYNFNKKYWNFPKLITYNLQTEPFLHIDMDLVLLEKPDGLSSSVVCEMVRGLTHFKRELSFLPKVVLKNYTTRNICSGLLGGDPKIFKTLFKVSSQLVKNKTQDVSFINLYGIEEIVLSSICKKNDIKPYEVTTQILHIQGAKAKMNLVLDKVQESELTI